MEWIITQWSFPRQGRFKLNSDGCCKGNPGDGLRDDAGQVIFASADYYMDTTNSIAETKALLKGLQICIEQGI